MRASGRARRRELCGRPIGSAASTTAVPSGKLQPARGGRPTERIGDGGGLPGAPRASAGEHRGRAFAPVCVREPRRPRQPSTRRRPDASSIRRLERREDAFEASRGREREHGSRPWLAERPRLFFLGPRPHIAQRRVRHALAREEDGGRRRRRPMLRSPAARCRRRRRAVYATLVADERERDRDLQRARSCRARAERSSRR